MRFRVHCWVNTALAPAQALYTICFAIVHTIEPFLFIVNEPLSVVDYFFHLSKSLKSILTQIYLHNFIVCQVVFKRRRLLGESVERVVPKLVPIDQEELFWSKML
jgi:hypothetical protein